MTSAGIARSVMVVALTVRSATNLGFSPTHPILKREISRGARRNSRSLVFHWMNTMSFSHSKVASVRSAKALLKAVDRYTWIMITLVVQVGQVVDRVFVGYSVGVATELWAS